MTREPAEAAAMVLTMAVARRRRRPGLATRMASSPLACAGCPAVAPARYLSP